MRNTLPKDSAKTLAGTMMVGDWRQKNLGGIEHCEFNHIYVISSPLNFIGYSVVVPVQSACPSHITVAIETDLCHALGFCGHYNKVGMHLLLQKQLNSRLIVKTYDGR